MAQSDIVEILTRRETIRVFKTLEQPILIKLEKRRGWIKFFTDGTIFTTKHLKKGPWAPSFTHFDPELACFVAKTLMGTIVKVNVHIDGFEETLKWLIDNGLIPVTK